MGIRLPHLSGQGSTQQDLGSEAEAATGLHDLLQHVTLDARCAHVLVHHAMLQVHVVHRQADHRAVLVQAQLGTQGQQGEGWKPEGQATLRRGHHPTPSQPPDPAPQMACVGRMGGLKCCSSVHFCQPAIVHLLF